MGYLLILIVLIVMVAYLLGLIVGGWFHSAKTQSTTTYPYRPDVETRLPDGKITTNGYAARHPAEFVHWQYGPYHVMGEHIDLQDWEEWRINYYGE